MEIYNDDEDLGWLYKKCSTKCNVCKNKGRCESEDDYEPVSLEELNKRIEEYYYKDDSYESKLAGAFKAASEERNHQGVFMEGYKAALEDFRNRAGKD